MAAVAVRSIIRSPSIRTAAVRVAGEAGASSRPSLRSLPKLRSATAARFLKSPVEMACCVESLIPLHSVTASALMTSMLAVSQRGSGWILKGQDETR